MSLTSIIKGDKDLRDKIKSTFKRPKLDKSKPILAIPSTKNLGAVGIAFDYIFRFYLERINKVNNNKIIIWPSERALDYLDGEIYLVSQNIIDEVKKLKKEFIKSGYLSRELVRQTLRMSYIDSVYRSGFGVEFIGKDADELEIDDIENQFKLVNFDLYRANNICLLNPSFDYASSLVGGADADVIIDDVLFDIKTTKNLDLKLDDFCQIIGYLLLYRISGALCNHGIENSEIKRLGIYYSRYGYLFSFSVDEIVDSESLGKFTIWFESYIHECANRRLLRTRGRGRKNRK